MGSPHPKPSGLRLPPGSVTVSSFFLNKRPAFLILTLLVALGVSLLFLLPGGLAQAQDANGPIEYAENGMVPVATLTAVDPEGKSIVWSLANSGDVEDFDIENGVLTFKNSPDFEEPKGWSFRQLQYLCSYSRGFRRRRRHDRYERIDR